MKPSDRRRGHDPRGCLVEDHAEVQSELLVSDLGVAEGVWRERIEAKTHYLCKVGLAVWTGQTMFVSVPLVFALMAEDHVALLGRLRLLLAGPIHNGGVAQLMVCAPTCEVGLMFFIPSREDACLGGTTGEELGRYTRVW